MRELTLMESSAVFSPCRRYRYSLTRRWKVPCRDACQCYTCFRTNIEYPEPCTDNPCCMCDQEPTLDCERYAGGPGDADQHPENYGKLVAFVGLMDDTGLDLRHRQADPKSLHEHPRWSAAVNRAWERVADGGLVVLLGDRGNGKTQAACQLIRRAAWEGRSGKYLRCREVGMSIRRAYGPDGQVSERAAMQEFVDPWLVVLDECQERMDTDHEVRTLTLILDKRYGACRPTVLIANCTEQAFRDLMGPSVVDRIKEGGGILVFGWESFRRTGAVNA